MKLFAKKSKLLDRWDLLALSAGVGAVVTLGLTRITQGSIWFDEAFSEHITRHSFFDIARYTAVDVHPPLYYWALKVWRTFFGDSELALRSMSLIFLVLAIVASYLLVRKYFNRKSALTAMVLLVVSPMLVRYGIEARMYTMEVFIAVLATGFLLKAHNSKGAKNWILYGVLVGLGLLTHYLTVIIWFAHAVWLYLQMSQKSFGLTVKKMLNTGYRFSILSGVAVSLVWLPFMITQLVHIQGGGFWIAPVNTETLPNYATNQYMYLDSNQAQGWVALGLMLLVGFTIRMIYLAGKQFKGLEKQAFSLLLTTAALPPALLFVASMPPLRSSFVDRYLLPSILMWGVVVAISASYLSRRQVKYSFPKTILVVTFIAMAIGCGNVYGAGNFNKDNGGMHTMRTAMATIREHSKPSEPIIADSSWKYYEASYYEQMPQKVYFRSEDHTKVGAYAMLRDEVDHKITDMDAFGREYKTAWFITAQPKNTESRTPKNWHAQQTMLVEGSKELRVIRMTYLPD